MLKVLGTLWDRVASLSPVAVHKQTAVNTTSCAIWLCLLLALLLLELHVPIVHDSSRHLIYPFLLFGAEAQDVHGILQRQQGGLDKHKG